MSLGLERKNGLLMWWVRDEVNGVKVGGAADRAVDTDGDGFAWLGGLVLLARVIGLSAMLLL